MEIAQALEIGGVLAGLGSAGFPVYLYFRSRGRLRVNMLLVDESGAAMPGAVNRRFLAVEAVNFGQEDVVLKTFNFEFREKYHWTYVTVGMLKEGEKDWVTIKPGHRYFMQIPLADIIVTSVSAVTSLGREYKANPLHLWAIRWQRHKIARNLAQT